ncbi:MAG: flagellar hook-associated protein FlgK [Oscillospiraceae bacterium]
MSVRPTFLGFETMRRSIYAAQKCLDISGNNLANVHTSGYTRQRVDLVSINTPGGNLGYKTNVALAGAGVDTPGVTQVRDSFLDKRYRELNADATEAGTTASILTDIENVIDSMGDIGKGFKGSYESFIAALNSYSSDHPDRVELANISLQSAKQLVQTLHDYDTKLNQIGTQTEFELNTATARITEISRQIATLNKQIEDGYVSGGDITVTGNEYKANTKYGPNELKDQRNLLLDELAQYGNTKVTENDNGSINVEFAGKTFVKDQEHYGISSQKDANGAMTLQRTDYMGNPIEEIAVGKNADLTTGALKGYTEMFNGAGIYHDSPEIVISGDNNFCTTNGIPYYKKMIDALANTVAAAFNKATSNEAADPAFKREMFSTGVAGEPIKASNIKISDAWEKDPEMITKSIRWVDDADHSKGIENFIPKGEELWTGNINKLLSVDKEQLNFKLDHTDPNGVVDSKCTIESYVSIWNNKLGNEIKYQNGVYDSADAMVLNIEESRAAVSGVSMQEEGINMMDFQKWFNASSRMMTTFDEALNTIISSMGLVGR